MTTRNPGRHRAAQRTRSRMALISDSVASGATSYRRRSAVIAASSGLLVSMGLPAAATPMVEVPDEATTTTRSVTVTPSVTATGRISVPQDAKVDFALSPLTTVDTAEADRLAAERAAAEAARAALAERAAAANRVSRATAERTRSADSDEDGSGSASAEAAADATSASTATKAAPAAVASSSAAIEIGSRYIGTPYRYGGTSPSGFDCSGFIQYVYNQLGVSLPRTATAQSTAGTRVSAAEARPGDIVSFLGSGGVYHNGMYVGNGQMLDSPRSGKSIAIRDIWSSNVMFTRVG